MLGALDGAGVNSLPQCAMTSSYYLSRSRWPTVCKMDAWRTFFRDLSAFIDGIAEGEHRATANVAESVSNRKQLGLGRVFQVPVE